MLRAASLVSLLLIGFSGCSHSRPAPSSPLEGKWKLISFSCRGGRKDKIVRMNERSVAQGLQEEEMTIDGSDVKTRFVAWEKGKTGSCTWSSSAKWDIQPGQYRVISAEMLAPVTWGTAVCRPMGSAPLTGQSWAYRVGGDKLDVIVTSYRKKLKPLKHGAIIPCNGGDWVRTYQKVQ